MTWHPRNSLVLWILLASPGFAAEEPSLEAWMPDDIIGYVRLSGAGARLEEYLSSDLRKEIESLSIVRLGMGHENWKKALASLEEFRTATGQEPLKVFRDLLGREVLVGVRFSFAGPEVIFLTRAAGEKELGGSLDAVRKLLGKYGLPTEGVQSTYADRSMETYGDKVSLVSVGSVLVLSNTKGALESVLDLASGKSSKSVSRSSGYKKAAGAFLVRSILSAAVRTQFLPNFKVPERADNPLGSLIGGGWLGALGSSELLAASLGLEGGSLELKVSSFGADRAREADAKDKYSSFYPEVIPDGIEERLRKRGVLAFTRISRNLAKWWGDREDLITPGAVGGLIEFAQVMSLAFGGRNFQDEVLPELGPTILLVARNQEYKGMAEKPAPTIPGFAAIFQLKNAKDFGEDMETAFQSIVGLINIDRAQKKKEGGMTMRLKPEKVGDVSLYTVVLKSLGKNEKPGIEHNFTPSLAVVGSRVVLGSSGELTKILIEELSALEDSPPAKAGSAPPRGGVPDVVQVDARAGLAILSANKDVLVANSMLKEGKTKSEAEGEIQMALDVLQRLLDLRIESGKTGNEDILTLKLRTLLGKRPAPAGAEKEVRL